MEQQQTNHQPPTDQPAAQRTSHDVDQADTDDSSQTSGEHQRPDFPGVVPAIGTTDNEALFHHTLDRLLARTHECKLKLEHIVHDAVMCAALHALFADNPTGEIRGRRTAASPEGQVLGHLVMAGGTSLSMCHQITERWSEDLDLHFVPAPDITLTTGEEHNAKQGPMDQIGRALGCDVEYIRTGERHQTGKLWGVYACAVHYGGSRPLAIDIGTRDDYADALHLLGITATTAMSLVGRHASPEQLAANPQWGGFTVPCVGPAYTSAMKYDAQHNRAARGDRRAVQQLAQRGRDILDLYWIANSPHVSNVRELMPPLAERVIRDFNNQGKYPRPEGGYQHSPAFDEGGEMYQVVADAVEDARGMAYAPLPSTPEMIEAARTLDS